MKRLAIVLTTAAFAAVSGSAFAADMGVRPAPVYKAPPPPVATMSWTGCYLKGGLGYGMLDDERTTNDTPPIPSTSAAKGWLGRVGGGCDFQAGGNFLIGAFADYDFANITGNYGDPFNSSHYGTQTLGSAWYVGARAGFLVTPTLLTFVSGGWTGAHIDQINILLASGAPRGLYLPAQDMKGWFLGGGTEYAFTFLPIKGLFWQTEYRYASYQNYTQNYIHTTGLPGFAAVTNNVNVQTITTSLVWRWSP